MAKFVFKMENILKIKRQLENQERMAYGMATARVNEEEEKLRVLMTRRIEYENKAKDLVSGSLKVNEIISNRNSINVMKSMIRAQMIEVQTARKNQELARKKLNDAMTERKIYEKLKEQAFENFKKEIIYEENKINDELVSYRYQLSDEDEA
ncbi:MAG: flagellar export protein FliJ [Lachnospiraceae bacterium]|nr:flagellar export protein FliJ [Lachnospiraceae bacterium]